jgi:dTDP-4-dehydrorhamnose reductase
MKPTILLTGKNGQIGSELLSLLPEIGAVVAPDRTELDLLDEDKTVKVIRSIRPALIVNAAAYTAVDAAENDEATAYTVNAKALVVLSEEAKKLGTTLVHFSTDYVFDGRKETPYLESDPANPLNSYGKTKWAGEEAIRQSLATHLIFRTSWVYGTRGRNFLLTVLRLFTEREELRIVSDQTGSPSCARYIAQATCQILADIQGRSAGHFSCADLSGTYHLTAAGQTTWFGFAEMILDKARVASGDLPWFASATFGRPMIVERLLPITAAEYRSPACRPTYSVLSNARLFQTFGFCLPTWKEQLQHCFETPPGDTRCSILRNPSSCGAVIRSLD